LLAELQVRSWESRRKLIAVEIVPIRTEGDRAQGTSKAGSVSKKAWVEDIEKALVSEWIDIAIHSGKDLPHDLEPGTEVLSAGERLFPNDVFIGRLAGSERLKLAQLTAGMRVGTGSMRRKRFLQAEVPGLSTVDHRGNVPTRLRKLDEASDLDGIILAEAGLKRLGIDVEYERIPTQILVPAPSQGTLAVQFRSTDTSIRDVIQLVHNEQVQRTFDIERKLALSLGADCGSCLGVFAQQTATDLNIWMKAASSSGRVATVHQTEPLSSLQLNPNLAVATFLQRVTDEAVTKELAAIMRA
jgi:hydroxymethylbilane synthase